jgi:hypothetical protein
MVLNVDPRVVFVISDRGRSEVYSSKRTLGELLADLDILRSEYPNIEVNGNYIENDDYVLPIGDFSLWTIPNPNSPGCS